MSERGRIKNHLQEFTWSVCWMMTSFDETKTHEDSRYFQRRVGKRQRSGEVTHMEIPKRECILGHLDSAS